MKKYFTKTVYSIAAIITFSLVLAVSCDFFTIPEKPVNDNPYDPLNPDFTGPRAKISMHEEDEGSVIDLYVTDSIIHITIDGSSYTQDSVEFGIDSLVFMLSGTFSSSSYIHRLLGKFDEWRPAQSDTVLFNYLNEADYIYEVKEVTNFGLTQETPTRFKFTVDAITGPAILMADKRTSHGSTIQLAVMADEVSNLKAAQVKITYNKNVLAFEEARQGDFLNQNADGQFFDVSESGDTLIISTARLGNSGVSGTGALSFLTFSSISSDIATTIQIQANSILRSSDNEEIDVTFYGKSIIE